ncbi:hypothetical protein DXG03_009704 [Asterophora parasitica]|uniref:Uncharacterized protein n=1 Tax=Asterophora parasitica TaxID=117018 RepID=A0A9P7G5X5_9AGAR|nr:hypothetical protein DXG03_009704 [Asterophora parasitica]
MPATNPKLTSQIKLQAGSNHTNPSDAEAVQKAVLEEIDLNDVNMVPLAMLTASTIQTTTSAHAAVEATNHIEDVVADFNFDFDMANFGLVDPQSGLATGIFLIGGGDPAFESLSFDDFLEGPLEVEVGSVEVDDDLFAEEEEEEEEEGDEDVMIEDEAPASFSVSRLFAPAPASN